MNVVSGGRSLLGKRGSSLVGSDIKVLSDGTVTGTLKKVTGYTKYSDNPDEQSGYYFPVTLAKTGTTMSIKKNGTYIKQDVPYEQDIVLRVERGDVFTIEVDDTEVVTLNFKSAIFA